MMSNIHSKNTKPELLIRKGLFAKGFRYVLYSKNIPGRPDIVLPKYRAVVFVNGCFWHMHDCSLFVLPKTRTEFWENKLKGNRKRDILTVSNLIAEGWRVSVIWECSIKRKGIDVLGELIDDIAKWLRSESDYLEMRGRDDTYSVVG